MIKEYLPWLLSAITIYMTVLAGNKHPKAWLYGTFNQVLWLVYIVETQAWGLVPMNLVLTGLYLKNHFKWNKSNEKT